MDLDDYYAEQERRMNLPHETLEEYHKRLAVLKRQSVEQHVDSFFAVSAARQAPSQQSTTSYNALEFSDVSRCKVTHKMSESEFESASKRQKLCDQKKAGEGPTLIQEDDIAVARPLHSSSSVQSVLQSSISQINEDVAVDSSSGGSKLPVMSGSQREPDRNPPHLSFAEISDDIQDSNTLKSRASPGQMSEDNTRSRNEQGLTYVADLARHPPLSHSTDGVQDDIDSFTEDNIVPLISKVNHAAKNMSAAGQSAPEDSPIGSFSMRLGSRNKQRIQEVIPSRRQQRLELRPVGDVAQLHGKKPERATSPIEDVSFVQMTSRTLPRKVLPENPIHMDSTTRIAKHAIKQNDKPLKRPIDRTAPLDQPAGEVAPAAKGSMICTTSSPQLQTNNSVVATSSKTKKEDNVAKKTTTQKPKAKGKKAKPQLMTPVEYAQMLQGKAAAACTNNDDEERSLKNQKQRKPAVKFLEGKNIFYAGGDMKYASETTRGRMDIIVRFGGNLMPEFNSEITTHIITDANTLPTLRALGKKHLRDIPEHIPTVRWSWVLSVLGKESHLSKVEIEKKLGDTWLHAAFSERMDAGYQPQKTVSLASLRDRSRILDKTCTASHLASSNSKASVPIECSQHVDSKQDVTPVIVGGTIEASASSSIVLPETSALGSDDPFLKFYQKAQAEQSKDDGAGWTSLDELDDSDDAEEIHIEPMKPVKRGWTCDTKEPQMAGNCPNQDIIDKLAELMQLHQAKVGNEDRWRAFTYNKCIRALRSYPKRIETFEEAKRIRGVGDKTARKIEEILQTGDLRRIRYEATEDVAVTRLFQGIYGVGQSTAMQWWAAGCRTLQDLREGKGGVKLSSVQEIGLLYYDDINSRMPREEARAIFDVIKRIAQEIDSRLFVEIMGSYRRGKATCGDIDILITRPTEDGKTHGGVLSRLLEKLHAAKILTEDLALPDDPGDLEAIYRGLCVHPGVADAKRRRIDFLCVPWKCRGAALIYYTGDDIFNRAMRLKANVMGYSLNQRGLFGNVVRDPRDRRVKLNDGVLIASESEEEIFKILDVPWQEPHERVRG